MSSDNLGSHVDILEQETAQQAEQIAELHNRIIYAENENIQLRKVQGQIQLVKLLFYGTFALLLMSGVLITTSLFIKQAEDKKIELYFNFLERLTLVICGAGATSMASLFRSNQNGNGD